MPSETRHILGSHGVTSRQKWIHSSSASAVCGCRCREVLAADGCCAVLATGGCAGGAAALAAGCAGGGAALTAGACASGGAALAIVSSGTSSGALCVVRSTGALSAAARNSFSAPRHALTFWLPL